MTQDLKVPKLRFPGFSGEWEERKIGNVVEVNPKSVIPESFEYVDLESVLGTELLSHRTEFKSTAPSRAQRVARTGDVFYQTVRPYQKNNYLFTLNDANYVFSTGYAQLRPKIDSHFLFAYLQNEHFVNKVLEKCTGTGYPAINCSDLSQISIGIPNSEEQQKIGSFFANLDSTITHQQRKLESLKKLKKGLLQKMFPKKGQSVPELRFPGFSGEWEEKKLTDLSDKKVGGGTPSTKVSEYWNGDLPWIQSSDIEIDNVLKVTVNKKITKTGLDNSSAKLITGNSIAIVTRVGVGKLVYMSFEYATSQDFISLSDIKTDHYFLTYLLYRQLKADVNIQGTSIKGITKDYLLSLDLLIPSSIQEQQKIGAFFANLDSTITHQQRKLDSLKKLKKGLLQQMFV